MTTYTRRTVLTSGLTAAALGAASAASAGDGGGGAHRGEHGWVTSHLRRMSTEQKIGQLFVQNVYGSDAATPDPRNLPLYGVASPVEVVQKYQLGGVIYFAWTDNVQDPDQIVALSNDLQEAASQGRNKVQIPLQIAIDQEGGLVTRIGPPATPFPGAMALGAGRSAEDARAAADIIGSELRAMGVNTNFAPVCDVNVDPANPVIGTRSFSSDPALAAEMAAAQVRGFQDDGGVAASAKHFPGHGDTAVDSHVAFPIITHTRQEWEEIDAPPFRAAIEAGIDMIMTAHLAFPALDDSGDPATLSHPILTGVLREELGFDGVIVTDALNMQGVRDLYGDAEVAVRALLAGADQLLMTPAMDEAHAAVTDAVRTGRISRRELDDKVARILRLKYRRDIVAQPYADPDEVSDVVGIPAHLSRANEITDRTTTLVRNDDGVLPIAVAGTAILVTGYGVTSTSVLADALTERGGVVTRVETGSAPSSAAIAAAVAAASAADVVVVLTMNASTSAGQQQLVAELRATGATVVVVAVRNPYDIASLGDAPTYLATYSYSPIAIESAARVLAGEVAPVGTLPVDIPAADDPDTVLYPFGHGLTW
ncbi:glycoside hydrolase family 3 protein [Pseudactinotalea suaedae]|uniref:glycoside hydrolase family 3 protein n=1 Tax=Pseudactinotalea suaedae TaxID=1524924 RepID=UPI0012E16C8F|nr:glycoside hydrolase family 3 protein [Pseudactinotalea suaedae]